LISPGGRGGGKCAMFPIYCTVLKNK
jgi:hypothetical protein